MSTIHHSGVFKKTNDRARLVITTILGIAIGFFIGVSFPSVSLYQIHLPSSLSSSFDVPISNDQDFIVRPPERTADNLPKIYVPTNPRGAELLPPGIVVPESDLYMRRLWGEPSEDLKKKPKYLMTFKVGIDQRNNIDKYVKEFSEDFQILLFHYDGWTTEWDQFEWSKNAIHVSVKKQTKWWYAKRFLHPDVVSTFEYIFIWDEDLGVEHFQAERVTDEKPGWCSDQHLPPSAAFVEIMAPVFSREAWRCLWYMIQNDLVRGWGLDFALRRCVEPAHEKIGVVDAQWIMHQVIPSLRNQGKLEDGKAP